MLKKFRSQGYIQSTITNLMYLIMYKKRERVNGKSSAYKIWGKLCSDISSKIASSLRKAADRQQEERVATIKTKAIVTTDDDIFNSIFKHCKSSFTSAFSYKSGRRKFCSHLYIVRSKAKTTVIYAGEWTNKNCTKTKVSVRCKWSNINNRIGASSTNKNTNCGSLKLRHDSMRNAPFHHQLSQLLNKSWQHTTVSMYLDSLWRLYKWLSVIRAGVCVCVMCVCVCSFKKRLVWLFMRIGFVVFVVSGWC